MCKIVAAGSVGRRLNSVINFFQYFSLQLLQFTWKLWNIWDCNNCNEKYFRETGRTLEQRIKEHKRDVRNGNTNNAMFVHIMNKSHSINWNSAKLIYKCSDYYKKRIVESTMITMINSFSNMNISDGSFKLNNSNMQAHQSAGSC